MKILVEAMCATFGGIRTYAEHLLAAWPDVFPNDEVHVLLRADSSLELDPRLVRHDAAVRRPEAVRRPWAQSVWVPRLAEEIGADAVLATSSSTTLFRPAAPMAVVVYDLRHELRPQQFSRRTRAMRGVSYRRGYSLADGIVSISQRSLDDLHGRHPRTAKLPAVVAHLGADHVDSWKGTPGSGSVVTFAHHTNKNLELSLAGWRNLVERRPDAQLLVLGVAAARRPALESQLVLWGLDSNVTLAPFLDEQRFRSTFASAQLVLFPSDFEGFGLPIAEGLRLGIPVVIGPERASLEVAGGQAEVMADWSPRAVAEAVERGLAWTPGQRTRAREHARRYTWSETARQTRGLLAEIAAARG